ncbi:MAG: type II toxin-antitoxin system RelE/ParE family toxin [Bacteriovoracaceae bacterium]|nr:type II toxin-antitoxin system RelE/ParE family toxin [Bacteriovoracaceae bacterium]
MEIKVFPQVIKVLNKETREIRKDIQDILEMLELNIEIGMPHIKYLSSIHNGLFEIRVKDRFGQFRAICILKKNDALYVIHAFRKKTEELPLREKRVILQRIKEIF